jgi:hypothetical protein
LQSWELASSKYVGQADKLEIQVRVDIADLSPKAKNSYKISILQSGSRILSWEDSIFALSLQLIG